MYITNEACQQITINSDHLMENGLKEILMEKEGVKSTGCRS
jgi:hypothetical protein